MTRQVVVRKASALSSRVNSYSSELLFRTSVTEAVLRKVGLFTTLLYARIPHGMVTWVGTIPEDMDGTLSTILQYMDWIMGHLMTTSSCRSYLDELTWWSLETILNEISDLIRDEVNYQLSRQ
jgi:hypothetical protein